MNLSGKKMKSYFIKNLLLQYTLTDRYKIENYFASI